MTGVQTCALPIYAVLRSTGGASGQTASSIEEMASRISRSTLQSKDDVEKAAGQLATFRNIGPDAFEKTMQAAADMSAVFGGDLASNVMKLGLAMDDPIAGMNRLRRSGLDLSPAQKEVIENLQRTGDVAGAQIALLDALEKKLGGSAAGQHQGLTGASHDLGLAWHEFLVGLDQTGHFTDIAIAGLDGLSAAMKNVKEHPIASALALLSGNPSALTTHLPDTSGTPDTDPAPNGKPYHIGSKGDADALFGPSRAAKERNDDTAHALDDYAHSLDAAAGIIGERSRFISQKLEEAAKQQNLSVAGLKQNFPTQYQAISGGAGKDFDSQHAGADLARQNAEEQRFQNLIEKLSNDADKARDEQGRMTAEYALQQIEANAQLRAADDALLVHELDGKKGYFDAIRKMNADWLADSLAVIDAQEAKQKADLEAKADTYKRAGEAFDGYQAELTAIEADATAKRKRMEVEGTGRDFDLQKQRDGSLGKIRDRGDQPWDQDINDVEAHGLDSMTDSLTKVVMGTESVSHAFHDMASSIIADLLKIAIQKEIEAPLAGLLLGGSGSDDPMDGILDRAMGSGGAPGGSTGGILGSLISDFGGWFAGGGDVDGGVPIGVGEAGPELFVPRTAGTIIPNSALGGSAASAPVVHVHVYGSINGDAAIDQKITGAVNRGMAAAVARSQKASAGWAMQNQFEHG